MRLWLSRTPRKLRPNGERATAGRRAHPVGARRGQAGVAEGDQPGQAGQQVDAAGQQGGDEPQGEQRHHVAGEQVRGGHHGRHRHRGGGRLGQPGGGHGRDLPNRPEGRNISTTAMGANTAKDDSSGTQTLAKESTSPIRALPTAAPWRLPRPPTTTTTSANSRMSVSAPGRRVSRPAATTPASPARAAPKTNMAVNTLGTSIPSDSATSRSSTPARMRAPSRVRCCTRKSSTPTATASDSTNSR